MSDAEDQSRFRNSVQEVDDRIKARLQTSIALLRAGTGLFAASNDVSVIEFNKFIEQIQLQKNYPGIQGIGFSQKFTNREKPDVVASVRRAGLADFSIWPAEPVRDEYHGIIYLQPEDHRNKKAFGYDMFTDAVRRQAMEAARDTGVPTASGKVVLVQEDDPPQSSGFLIYAPVYRNEAPVGTTDERRASLRGFVYSPFRADDFFSPITSTGNNISFQVYDGVEVKPESLLFSSKPNALAEEGPHFIGETTQDVAGRKWTVAFATNPSFNLGSSRTFLPYTFAAGVLLSLLFFVVTRAEVSARTAAERPAITSS